MSKDAFYFSHDSNARSDPKIIQMLSVYKSEGYGWYWMLVEMMREQEDYRLPIKGKYAINAYATELHADALRLQEFIKDCIGEFELFTSDKEYIWSESLLRRMQARDEISEKARKSAFARWVKEHGIEPDKEAEECERTDNICERTANARKTDAIKESKVNKRNIKEKKLKQKFGEFNNVLLTNEEYEKLINKFGEKVATDWIEKLSAWMKSNGKSKSDHYATILNWSRRDNGQAGQTRKDGRLDPDRFTKGKYGHMVRQAPRCPKCGSDNTKVYVEGENERTHRCLDCGNDWDTEIMLKPP